MSPFLLLGLLSVAFFAVTLSESAEDLIDDAEEAATSDAEDQSTNQTANNTQTTQPSGTSSTPDQTVSQTNSEFDDATGGPNQGPEDNVGSDTVSSGGNGTDLNGTGGNDTITASLSQVVNGLGGDDVINSSPSADGGTLNGNGGNDQLNPLGPNTTVNGGLGDDTISTSAAPDGTLNGGDGNDVFNLDGPGLFANGDAGNDSFTALVDSRDIVMNGGDGNDTISAAGRDGAANGGDGDDEITVEGRLTAVNGDAGNDTITSFDGERGGGTPIEGGAGEDLIQLTANPNDFIHTPVAVGGGLGDDTISTETAIDPDGTLDITDVLAGGEGADSFELSFYLPGTQTLGASGDSGVTTRVADFNAAEDALVIEETLNDTSGSPTGLTLEDEITLERPAGEDFTNVILTYANSDGSSSVSVTVQLDGIDDSFTEDDIVLV